MKSITHRTLTVLAFGLLTLGTGSAFAGQAEKAHGCCSEQTSCCSDGCCTHTRTATAYDQTAERFKAKFGREYPGKRFALQTASQSCCKHC
jgi:hypothetical protein